MKADPAPDYIVILGLALWLGGMLGAWVIDRMFSGVRLGRTGESLVVISLGLFMVAAVVGFLMCVGVAMSEP